tara:strand:- start:428 stop:613 length:186 start_codon:yes stop_codon:yes gene_type:complete
MDKMEKLSLRAMQLLILLGIVFWIVIGAVLLKDLFTDDIIGYTDHGIIIRESDLEEDDEQK